MAAKRRREIYLQQMISAIVAEVETSHGNGGKVETLDVGGGRVETLDEKKKIGRLTKGIMACRLIGFTRIQTL